MTLTLRPKVASALATAFVIAAGACGTEPSDLERGGYRLAAADDAIGGTLPCFASFSRYEGGSPVHEGTCDVALRSYEARFDSAGAVPTLVLTARVRLEGGDTATWQVGIPTRIHNDVIEYDFSSVVTPLTAEQVFITPLAGTIVGGVLTLRMTTFASTNLPDGAAYLRQGPSVFILTSTGRLPGPSPLAPSYTGVSFAGSSGDDCPAPSVGDPIRCIHRSFTLASSGGAWLAAYDEVVTAQDDTLGGRSLSAGSLTVAVQPSSFVRVASPGTAIAPLRFDAEGSLVSGTLTLFITSTLLDGTSLPNPIVATAR